MTFHSCFVRIVDGASASGQSWSVHGNEEEQLTGIFSVYGNAAELYYT